MRDMKDPTYRTALARRIARVALDLAAVRAEIDDVATARYDCGRTLAEFCPASLDTLALDADKIQGALHALATRLDRDLGDVEPHADAIGPGRTERPTPVDPGGLRRGLS